MVNVPVMVTNPEQPANGFVFELMLPVMTQSALSGAIPENKMKNKAMAVFERKLLMEKAGWEIGIGAKKDVFIIGSCFGMSNPIPLAFAEPKQYRTRHITCYVGQSLLGNDLAKVGFMSHLRNIRI